MVDTKANWHPDLSRHIRWRVGITGTLVLETPASFSNGETDGTELVILEDALEHRPLIPGASLAGALRHYLLTREVGYGAAGSRDRLTTELFGEALDETKSRIESRVIVYDALGKGSLTRREGVKIDAKYHTADEGMLFAAQMWEAGTAFDLRFELILYEDDPAEFSQAFAAALVALTTGEIPLGGRKQRGYGRVSVKDWRVCLYDLVQPAALGAWLQDDFYSDDTAAFFQAGENWTYDQRAYLRIQAALHLYDSLLIRAVSDVADNEHLTSQGQPVLSGTALAGALRARALRIAQTVNPAYAEGLVNDLFGRHGADGEGDSLSASRVRVEERHIEGGTFEYVQNRVKIDRFTGGAFETALFSERPLFALDDTRVTVNLELRYPADEAQWKLLAAETGLLLLVLKDLWTEDLPLGGEASIGRGRLRGLFATLTLKNTADAEPEVIELNEQGLANPRHNAILQPYVKALWDYQE